MEIEKQKDVYLSNVEKEKVGVKILLLPQSTKLEKYTMKRMVSQKMLECLEGLVTARDLHLEASLDEIYNFIINNPGWREGTDGPGRLHKHEGAGQDIHLERERSLQGEIEKRLVRPS